LLERAFVPGSLSDIDIADDGRIAIGDSNNQRFFLANSHLENLAEYDTQTLSPFVAFAPGVPEPVASVMAGVASILVVSSRRRRRLSWAVHTSEMP
jgi:hypothetical protein